MTILSLAVRLDVGWDLIKDILIDKLLDFLRRLDRKVTIQTSPHRPGDPYQEVGFAP